MKKFVKSFGFAARGVVVALKEQQNLRVHLGVIAVVIVSGIYLKLKATEWSIITLTIGMVIVAEMFNTAIEYLVDLVSPVHNRLAGKIKDVSAAAVLTAALIATIVAIYIFGNKIFNLLF